ncbi:MAG: M23 family metallopeptidase [Acidobacteriota bacterium]|nr:M23 family metallopeptidase [Acidobacteriota bacterium]
MKQDYFIVVLAHSLHGRLQRVHIPHRFIYSGLGALGLLLLLMFGVVGSYARMALKVANYNSLQQEAQMLRVRYDNLQKKVKQTNEQLASLQVLADEVTTAYGVKKQITGSPDLISEAPLVPTMRETLAEYDYLRTTNLAGRGRSIFSRNDVNILPVGWPINGRLMDGYGHRSDPFSGEGAMHTGVDISAPFGTAVKATADGIVVHASWNTGYGRCVIVDHGNGYQTWYAHLSGTTVREGDEVRQGEVVGQVGSTGKSTGPHLHYEVRVHSTPVNPYRFLAGISALKTNSAANDFPF